MRRTRVCGRMIDCSLARGIRLCTVPAFGVEKQGGSQMDQVASNTVPYRGNPQPFSCLSQRSTAPDDWARSSPCGSAPAMQRMTA